VGKKKNSPKADVPATNREQRKAAVFMVVLRRYGNISELGTQATRQRKAAAMGDVLFFNEGWEKRYFVFCGGATTILIPTSKTSGGCASHITPREREIHAACGREGMERRRAGTSNFSVPLI
jgi:hypothetical protein